MVKGKEANGNKVIKHIEKRTLEILKFFILISILDLYLMYLKLNLPSMDSMVRMDV